MSREIEFAPAKLGQSERAVWQLANGEEKLTVRRGGTAQLHVRVTLRAGHFIYEHVDKKYMPEGPRFELSSTSVASLESSRHAASIFPAPHEDSESTQLYKEPIYIV